MTVKYFNNRFEGTWERGDSLPKGSEFMKKAFVEQYSEPAASFVSMHNEYTDDPFEIETEWVGKTYPDIMFLFGNIAKVYRNQQIRPLTYPYRDKNGVIRGKEFVQNHNQFDIYTIEEVFGIIGLNYDSDGTSIRSPFRFRFMPEDDYVYSEEIMASGGNISVIGAIAGHLAFEDMRLLWAPLHSMVHEWYYYWMYNRTGVEPGAHMFKSRHRELRDDVVTDTGWVVEPADELWGGIFDFAYSYYSPDAITIEYYNARLSEFNWSAKHNVIGNYTLSTFISWDEDQDEAYVRVKPFKCTYTTTMSPSSKAISVPFNDITWMPSGWQTTYSYFSLNTANDNFQYSDYTTAFFVCEIDSEFKEDW